MLACPVIRPTRFNYPIDILGKWHGNRYRFVQRYRSGQPETRGEEFDRGSNRSLLPPSLCSAWEIPGNTSARHRLAIRCIGAIRVSGIGRSPHGLLNLNFASSLGIGRCSCSIGPVGLRGVSKWPAVVGAGQRSRNTTERKHCPYRKDGGDCRRQVPIDGHIQFLLCCCRRGAPADEMERLFVTCVQTVRGHMQMRQTRT